MKLPTLDLAGDLKGARVLLRLDLNVPLVEGSVRDDFRIQKILPTIDRLRKARAKVLIISHLESTETDTLEPILHALWKHFPARFMDALGHDTKGEIERMHEGDVMLFENIRLHGGEKKNELPFAKTLSLLGDVYVNDAFSASHRAHASIVGIPKFLPHYAGPLFVSEVENLSKAFKPSHPFLFILGGAKIETKLPLVLKFQKSADTVFIGGVLANDIFKAKGFTIGNSVFSGGKFDLSKLLLAPNLLIPEDVVIKNAKGTLVRQISAVASQDSIYDAGPQTLSVLEKVVHEAETIVWNGPLGNYEKGFKGGTEELARAISKSSAFSIVGGGDTVAVIGKLGIENKFGFVSSGGGAMLDFLANETLPGIEALRF